MRQCGASQDDLNILLAKKFVLAFESGVIVVKHWRLNNYLRNDRYKPTVYRDEMNSLTVDENGTYHSGIPSVGIPSVGIPSIGKDRLGKDSIGQDSVGKERGAGETRTTRKTRTEMNLELLNDIPDIPDAVHQILVEWLTYKGQKKQGYTSQGLKALVKRMINNVNQYGLSAVRDVVENSMGNEYQGIVWDRLKNAEPRKDDNTFLQMLKELENDESGDNQGFGNAESGIPTVLPWLEQG